MRSDQDHSTCFPPRLLLPYISHHIHNDSLTREIKVLEYSGVWSGHDVDQMFRASILDSNPFPRAAWSMRCRTSILLHTRVLLMVRHLCFVFKTWFGESVRNMNANWFWSNPCCCHHNRTAYLYFNSWTSSKKRLVALVQPGARNHVLLSRVVIYTWINNITTLLPKDLLVAIL